MYIYTVQEILERKKKIKRPIYQVQRKYCHIIFKRSLYKMQKIEYSWQKDICKFKNQKDLKREKIKILLRFIQTRETLSIHTN